MRVAVVAALACVLACGCGGVAPDEEGVPPFAVVARPRPCVVDGDCGPGGTCHRAEVTDVTERTGFCEAEDGACPSVCEGTADRSCRSELDCDGAPCVRVEACAR